MGDLFTISFVEGEVGVTLGALFRYFTFDFPFTIVAVTVSPSADDADLTVDINDDGSAAIAAIACATKDARHMEIDALWRRTGSGRGSSRQRDFVRC